MGRRAKSEAAALPVALDYERTRQQFKRFEDFERFVAGYPESSGVSFSCYRLRPVINLKLIGEKKTSIKVSPEPLTADLLRSEFGNGEYMVIMNDANNRAPKSTEVARSWVSINEPDCDPVLDPRALVLDSKENAAYIRELLALGVLVRDEGGDVKVKTDSSAALVERMEKKIDALSEKKEAAAVPAVASGPRAASEDVMGKAFLVLVEKALNQSNQPSAIDTAFKIAERLAPPAAGGMSPILEKAIERLLLRELSPDRPAAEASAASDPLAFIDKLTNMKESLERLGMVPASPAAASVAAAEESGFLGGLKAVFGGIADLAKHAPSIMQAWAMYQSMRPALAAGPAAGIPMMPPAVAAPRPLPIAAAAPGPRLVVPGEPAEVPAEVSAAVPVMPMMPAGMPALDALNLEGDSDMKEMMALFSDPVMIQKLQELGGRAQSAFERGISGIDFAHGLCMYDAADGRRLFDALDRFGTEKVVGVMSMLPALAGWVDSHREGFTKWLDSFFEYDPDASAEDEGAAE